MREDWFLVIIIEEKVQIRKHWKYIACQKHPIQCPRNTCPIISLAITPLFEQPRNRLGNKFKDIALSTECTKKKKSTEVIHSLNMYFCHGRHSSYLDKVLQQSEVNTGFFQRANTTADLSLVSRPSFQREVKSERKKKGKKKL